MKPTAPPRLFSSARISILPPLMFGGLALLILLTPWIAPLSRYLPRCGMKQFTGLPCFFCGGTRALLAWADFDLVQAFLWNPLVFVLVVGATGWFASWVLEMCSANCKSWNRQLRAWAWARRTPLLCALTLGVILNWIYLWLSAA